MDLHSESQSFADKSFWTVCEALLRFYNNNLEFPYMLCKRPL